MYLSHCDKDNYFEVEEIWFDYYKREYYKNFGFDEGSIIYVLDNNENIKVNLNGLNLEFTYDEGLLICGKVLTKKQAKIKKI